MKKLGSIFAVLVILIAVFCTLKGCIVHGWSISEPTSYSTVGEDGRKLTLIFLPDHKTMLWYSDTTKENVEGVMTRTGGVYATHYFWRLWSLGGRFGILGLRIYPANTKPVMIEIRYLEKYKEGRGESAFPDIDSERNTVLLFSDNSVKYEGMWLSQVELSEYVIQELRNKLDGEKP